MDSRLARSCRLTCRWPGPHRERRVEPRAQVLAMLWLTDLDIPHSKGRHRVRRSRPACLQRAPGEYPAGHPSGSVFQIRCRADGLVSALAPPTQGAVLIDAACNPLNGLQGSAFRRHQVWMTAAKICRSQMSVSAHASEWSTGSQSRRALASARRKRPALLPGVSWSGPPRGGYHKVHFDPTSMTFGEPPFVDGFS